MDDGVTSFVVNEIEEAVEAMRRVRDLSRAQCPGSFEKRFTVSRMASDYIDVYTRAGRFSDEKNEPVVGILNALFFRAPGR
jgi:hypothetical protein